MQNSFIDLLNNKWKEGKFVCIGLDSDYSKLPASSKTSGSVESDLITFNLSIIDSTYDLVNSYKINPAFYESEGADGWNALLKTIHYLKETYPDIPVILDAKRGDIGNTNLGYLKMAFELLQADAITVQSYLGQKALEPFLKIADKGIIVLVKTSNEGSGEFQDLKIEGKKLYEIVAENVAKNWNHNGNCAVVVGATYPEDLKKVRKIVGDMPILIPGIGAQGGELEETVKAGLNSNKEGIIISSSRAIIFASEGEDFPHKARVEAEKLHKQIEEAIKNE